MAEGKGREIPNVSIFAEPLLALIWKDLERPWAAPITQPARKWEPQFYKYKELDFLKNLCEFENTDVPKFLMIWLMIFPALPWFKSDSHKVETVLQVLNFDLFLGKQYAVRYSLLTLGRGQEQQFPVSHGITRVNNWYTSNHSVFHFQTVFN